MPFSKVENLVDDDELRELYDELLVLLRHAGFDWLIDAIESDISRGVPEEISLPRYYEADLEEPQRRRSRAREKVLAMRAFTEKEKITFLLDEIDRVLVEPCQLAAELPNLLRTSDQQNITFDLVDPETNKSEFTSRRLTKRATDHAADLKSLLETLRKQVW
jgi:hypothetical protein